MTALWVKICGVTRAEDARTAYDCGADAIGINFWPRSKRYCDPERARLVRAALPEDALVYGVFVRASREQITDTVRDVGLTGVQLHGGEDVEAARGWDLPVIRAVAATSREAIAEALSAARGHRVLVDHGSGGGSGRLVDPRLLDGIDLGGAILAGGLTPENVAASVTRFRPYGVDTAGGVESAPGIKDPRLVEAFVRAARGAMDAG